MREGTGLESVKDEGMKNDKSTCGTTVSRQRANRAAWRDMTRSVGEHAAESSQPCLKGQNSARVTALEAAYEKCQFFHSWSAPVESRTCAPAAKTRDAPPPPLTAKAVKKTNDNRHSQEFFRNGQ
jgi:hypothetical protein